MKLVTDWSANSKRIALTYFSMDQIVGYGLMEKKEYVGGCQAPIVYSIYVAQLLPGKSVTG